MALLFIRSTQPHGKPCFLPHNPVKGFNPLKISIFENFFNFETLILGGDYCLAI
jgi:hypothetical protein